MVPPLRLHAGQIETYAKATTKGSVKPKVAKLGHPGYRRLSTFHIDRDQSHTLTECLKYHGPVQPCRFSRTRVIEDIPENITPVVTKHVSHRYWCPACQTTVEPIVANALPGCRIGLRVVILSAWLHNLVGTTLAQILDLFYYYLQFKLTSAGSIQMWQRLRDIVLAWYLEIRNQALDSAVLHADETGRRVDGKTHWLWCFAINNLTYYQIDRSRG